MIRCFVADDHAAVRAGLVGLLGSEPGFVPVGAVANAAEAMDGEWRMAFHQQTPLS